MLDLENFSQFFHQKVLPCSSLGFLADLRVDQGPWGSESRGGSAIWQSLGLGIWRGQRLGVCWAGSQMGLE